MDAEKEGPQLSHPQDSRVTSIGMFLRNSKIDELPQLINVLIGNMSFVGPRPERQFFIDEIVKSSPEFEELLMVKPGITSLGQVQYGYAMCVEEMLERMTLDLKYVRNRSAGFDVKILWLTLFFLMKKLKG